MKITDVRLFVLEGPLRSGLAEYHDPRHPGPKEPRPYRDAFCEIDTDAGFTGLSYGGPQEFWPLVKDVGRELIGQDPMCYEFLWEQLYTKSYFRFQRYGAISVLDLALWDLIGKVRNEPVYRLLGGPTRERVRAYAAMLFYPTDPESAARASAEMIEKGFTALKWYLTYGPKDGEQGFRKNVALVKAVREAVGDSIDIMLDFLFANPPTIDLLYLLKLTRKLEEYRPAWLEEPLNFDDIEAHATLARAVDIPIAVGEHWYTRWQMKQILQAGAAQVLQPDPLWGGGITEMCKIMNLASAYGAVVSPHGNESCRPNLHLLFSQPERMCPTAEWNAKINANRQYFYQDFYEPQDGYFYLPTGPGLGWELGLDKSLKRVDF